MIYQVIAILILTIFYTFYFAKIIIQKRQSIKTNQMGIGNKSKKVLLIERFMSVATVRTFIYMSYVFQYSTDGDFYLGSGDTAFADLVGRRAYA